MVTKINAISYQYTCEETKTQCTAKDLELSGLSKIVLLPTKLQFMFCRTLNEGYARIVHIMTVRMTGLALDM